MFETVILFTMPLPFTLANKFATTLFQTSKFIKRLFVLSAWFGAQWPCKRSKWHTGYLFWYNKGQLKYFWCNEKWL